MKEFLKDGLEPLSYLVYAIAIFVSKKNNKSNKKDVLFVYYLMAALTITVACYTTDTDLNRVLYNLFFFATICIFSHYFRSLLSGKTKKIVSAIFLIHLVMFIKISIISHQLLEINNYIYAITYLSIVIYALLYFENILRNVNEMNLLHQFDFWLIAGYLFYFLSCFFLILFYDNIEIKHRALLWSLQNIILFFSAVFALAGSLWINYQKKYY